MHLASSTDITPLRSNDKTLYLNNPSFDLSLFEVWVSLLAGAEIVVAPKTVTLNGSELQDFVSRKGATVGFLSTSHFHLIAFNYPQAFSGLRLLLVAGSALNPAAIKKRSQKQSTSAGMECIWSDRGDNLCDAPSCRSSRSRNDTSCDWESRRRHASDTAGQRWSKNYYRGGARRNLY
jgi:non-ribosomal peptide synthetase component F